MQHFDKFSQHSAVVVFCSICYNKIVKAALGLHAVKN